MYTSFFYRLHRFVYVSILCVLCIVCVGCSRLGHTDHQTSTTDTTAWVVDRIRTMQRLYTTAYHVHKVVAYDDQIRLRGKLFDNAFNMKVSVGDRKILIPIDATLKGYIDFQNFSSAQVQRMGNRIIITLPDPQIVLTSSHIQHHAVRQYISTLRSKFTQHEIDTLAAQGVDSIRSHVLRYGILASTRQRATEILVPLLVRLGYSAPNIFITYRSDISTDSSYPVGIKD